MVPTRNTGRNGGISRAILSDTAGSRYGYQLTFFRQGIRQKLPAPSGPWDIRDVYLGHFAITDTARKKFQYGERISRSGPGLAGAGTEGLDVWLLDWSARMKGVGDHPQGPA